ncbi:MAG: ROK family protein [Candidatus Thermoplasmatota archaeon]|nr:ROK family protein [Candidatus Thermoplasmatota archaeon]
MSYLCVDIGATNVLIGTVDNDLEEIKERSTESFFRNIEKELETLRDKVDQKEVFVAAAGPIDKNEGYIFPPNLPENRIQILRPFEKFFEKVVLINDCNAAALGEYTYGRTSAENLLYLTLSTGIGAGVIADGSLIQGATNNFAEVGHMKIADEGECGCGGTGHWEALCSGKNLPRLAEREVGRRFDSAQAFFEEYKKGDEELKPVVEKVIDYNVTAISNLINLYDPAHISIGGSMGLNQFDLLVDRGRIKEKVIHKMPTIERSSLGKKVVLQGLKAISEKEKRREGDYRDF